MIKTKHISAYGVGHGTTAYKFTPLDRAINEFIEKENITEDRLIDIKPVPVGFFQGNNNGEGEIEATVLVIYRT